ncbi:YfiR family protein [Nitrospina watsonii]|uniref:YfiR family protein n=1 Tax=Nitrospina watsonii TaxID=1323948 RepID=A0ABM9HAR9_9BACT|nr:YfiR family protein [Nitrospina watsonii]CAI2717218.1 conserved protein of unknown function [Nitrospina watsonii]
MLKRPAAQHASWKWWTALLYLAGWLLLSGAQPASLREVQSRETLDSEKATALKVAYMRYIAEYTTWPLGTLKNPEQPLTFCMLGHDVEGMARRIDRLIVETDFHIQGRPVQLNILRKGLLPFLSDESEMIESIRPCHLLYVLPSEKDRWDTLSPHIQNLPVVTISEIEGFSQNGGMIQFVLTPVANGSGLRYSLHINLKNTLQAGLRLSAKFLNLKQAVRIVEFP